MTNTGGVLGVTSSLGLKVIRNPRPEKLDLDDIAFFSQPHGGLDEEVAEWRAENFSKHFYRGLEKVKFATEHNIPTFYGRLWAKKIDSEGQETDYGLVSLRVVTTVGVNYIVDAFQNLTELENLKYHGIGTTNTAEAAGDTALAAELTTQYNPDNTRATGPPGEGATANIYRTVGANTVDSSVSIVEHGIFSQAATGGGTLLDRSVFATISLASGDSLQTTYDLTFAAGS